MTALEEWIKNNSLYQSLPEPVKPVVCLAFRAGQLAGIKEAIKILDKNYIDPQLTPQKFKNILEDALCTDTNTTDS